MQKDEGEQEGERDGERHDHSGAQADEKKHQHNEDEDHPQHHVVLDGVDCQLHQIAAVVVGTNPDIGRQNFLVELSGFRLHSLQHVLRLLATAHHDDAFDGIVGLVESEFAQPRSMPDGHRANVADSDRHTALRPDDHVADVLRIPDQTQSAYVVKLAALRIEPAAGVGIVGRELLITVGTVTWYAYS